MAAKNTLPSGSTGLEVGSKLELLDDGSVWRVVGHSDYDDLPIILKESDSREEVDDAV